MKIDPVANNPGLYSVIFENDRVRVLLYGDNPGQATVPHDHPDSVMITLTGFQRRLIAGEKSTEVELPEGTARWLSAQRHSGENIGETKTKCIFVELKEPAPNSISVEGVLGPSES